MSHFMESSLRNFTEILVPNDSFQEEIEKSMADLKNKESMFYKTLAKTLLKSTVVFTSKKMFISLYNGRANEVRALRYTIEIDRYEQDDSHKYVISKNKQKGRDRGSERTVEEIVDWAAKNNRQDMIVGLFYMLSL